MAADPSSPAGRSQQGAPSERAWLMRKKTTPEERPFDSPEASVIGPNTEVISVVDPREYRLQVLAEVEEALRARRDFAASDGEADACHVAAGWIAREFGLVASLAATEERNEDGE
jgi:hypothetical protein